jgi:hypothetical protein
VYEEVTESMMYMRVVVDYLMDFYSMEDKDTIVGGEYTDWFSIQISDINDWNYKLDSMQYEQELGYAKDEFEDRETDTPTTFGFIYKGIEWKCEDTDYSEIEGMHTAVNCYTVYKDRLDIRVGSRSADDAEGSGPPLSDSEMQDRVEEKIDLIDFSVIDEVIDLYSDWDFEEYPLR